MARARNLKPGFFRDAALVELPIEARLLFPGLWTLADRQGKLEDRPKQIKMEIYPADNFNVDDLLNQLQTSGLIIRYSIDGKRFIKIKNFEKHQNPHRDERESEIPEPIEHGASTVQAQCEHGGNRASTSNLTASTLTSGTDVPAGKPAKMTSDEIIFSYGVPLLTNAGTAEKQARSFLGGLRKAHGDAAVIDKLRECMRAKPLQPLEWLAKAMPPSGFQGVSLSDRNRAAVDEAKTMLFGQEAQHATG